jgi:hypothetical protein
MPDEREDRNADVEPDGLADLEIGTPPTGADDDRSSLAPARDGFLPLALVGLAVLGGILLAAVVFLFRTPVTPRAAVTPSPAGPSAAAAVPSPSGVALPTLDASDALARTLGATLSSQPEFARWLARTGLVRTFAAVVTNVADGESPRPHLEFLAPPARFQARSARGRLVADPAGFQGYDVFGDAVASVNATAAATAYRTVEPLLEEAHRELGHPEGRFRDSLDRAIAALLAVPVPREDAALILHATTLRWEDPRLESLTPAQKQFLRTGPRNVRLVQEKLRELQSALGTATPLPR